MTPGEIRSYRITLEALEGCTLGYVYLGEITEGQLARMRQVGKGVYADYDAEGTLLGVEFLQAEKADSSFMREVGNEIGVPSLAGLDLAKISKTMTR